jgi:protoheme ferro-lyase
VRRYAASEQTENYFIQRVRMLLVEAGLSSEHVKVARLEWQTPDVTETVRHLAVLGCRRIITIPATTVLPTLETQLDLERAVSCARVPTAVTTVTLGPWGDDDALAAAVGAVASAALDDTQGR